MQWRQRLMNLDASHGSGNPAAKRFYRATQLC